MHWRRHHHPAPPPIPAPLPKPPVPPIPPPPGSKPLIGMNFGYENLPNGQYDLNQSKIWLMQLRNAGITSVRLAFYGTNASVTKPLALLAKSMGFYVQTGNDGDPNASGYEQGVIAFAQWCQANKIDQMSIGNEADAGGMNQAVLANLSVKVKAVAPNVLLSYDTYKGSYDPIYSWARNMGKLDLLGLNCYADYANTTAQAESTLPGRWYISETNKDCDAGLCGNDAQWAAELQQIKDIYAKYPVKVNYFCFVSGGDNVDPHWGMLNHPTVSKVLGL